MPELRWIGKEQVINHHLDVPFRLLNHEYNFTADNTTPASPESTGNAIIKGDNLEALKSLLPQYEGRINCIYIDPPYNTGNEGWVYNDNVNDPKIKKWLAQVVGKEGEDLSRHDKWLCMMYPRLQLLYKLLADDGVIFISIDDNEHANLKLVMDEIFGKNSMLTNFTWKTEGNFDNQAKIKVNHEYIVCYCKNANLFPFPKIIDPNIAGGSKLYKEEIRNTIVKNGHKNPISEVRIPRGFPADFEEGVITARSNSWPHYLTDAVIKDSKLVNDVVVKSGWSSKEILVDFINTKFEFVKDTKGQETTFIISKTGAIENIKRRGSASHVVSSLQNMGSTQNMSNALKEVGINFNYPKPVKLIEYLLSIISGNDFYCLDSFAGSGTTAHAVLNLNKQDGGSRKFILVEMEDYAETITAERVKRVINGYGNTEGTGGSFDYYTLGQTLFNEDGELNSEAPIEAVRQYIWYTETKTAYKETEAEKTNGSGAYLGRHQQTVYYFNYHPGKATTLNLSWLKHLHTHVETHVVYADNCTLNKQQLQSRGIIFKKIPRDIAKL